MMPNNLQKRNLKNIFLKKNTKFLFLSYFIFEKFTILMYFYIRAIVFWYCTFLNILIYLSFCSRVNAK